MTLAFGPDEYRDMPQALADVFDLKKEAFNVVCPLYTRFEIAAGHSGICCFDGVNIDRDNVAVTNGVGLQWILRWDGKEIMLNGKYSPHEITILIFGF
jgi:hypothetical protein